MASTKDAVDKLLLRHNEVFAELFNFAIYNGAPVIDPNDLRDIPTNLVVKNEKTKIFSQKNRDVAKQLVIKDGKKHRYAVLAVENQSSLDPSMPLRCLEYDVASMRESYNKDHTIRPVVTIVFNTSGKPWTTNRTIKNMCNQGSFDPVIDQLGVMNYKIIVVSPCEWDTNYIEKMQTDLFPLALLLNVSSSKERLSAFAQNDRLKSWKASEDLWNAIEAHTDGVISRTDKEDMNMCKALNDLIKEKDAAIAAAQTEAETAKKQGYLFIDIGNAFHNGADTLEKLIAAGFDEEIAKEYLSYRT